VKALEITIKVTVTDEAIQKDEEFAGMDITQVRDELITDLMEVVEEIREEGFKMAFSAQIVEV
jgi:hypothetical protein